MTFHAYVAQVPYNYFAKDLTLIGITAIEDPLREGVRDAIAKCHNAVKMCTGDYILTGRCVNDGVRKFLQFQISTIVAAVCITFVTAVCSKEGTSALSAVQLLWVSIIMDTFAALALATDPASEVPLVGNHRKQTVPLFSVDMYKQILFQSMYQILVVLVFHFLGGTILGFDTHTGNASIDKHNAAIMRTLVFNVFVFAQIFNSVNCRRLDRNFNVLEGITRNKYFVTIILFGKSREAFNLPISADIVEAELVVQVLIIFVGGIAFQVTAIGGREWGISLASGILCIPMGALVRLIPNKPFERAFKLIGILEKDQVLPTVRPRADRASSLETFAKVRGGRLRSSSFIMESGLSHMPNMRNTPPSNFKLLQLLKLFLRLFLFGVPGVQYAKGSDIRSQYEAVIYRLCKTQISRVL